MGAIKDQLDYSMSEGSSIRVRECDNCAGRGNSNAVQITRKADGFLWHCFRCEKSGFYSDTGASPSDVQKVLESQATEKVNTRPAVVELPNDYEKSMPAKALVQLYDLGISNLDIDRFEIGWSKSHARIIIPVYKYIVSAAGTKGKQLVGVMGRKLDDADKDKPKWWAVRQKDIKHPRFIALPEALLYPKQVVIVEDIFSSIRVAAQGYISTALMTTYLPYEMYNVLRGWTVHLWLDADAHKKAIKYQSTLGANGIPSSVIYTAKDPKAYEDKEIQEAITNGRVKS